MKTRTNHGAEIELPASSQQDDGGNDALSFEERCRAWIDKQPFAREKVELGRLLMIPLMELSSAQLARLNELREVLESHGHE